MSVNALGFYVGMVLVHDGRPIRLVEDMGDWVFHFEDVQTGLDYLVAIDGSAELLNPNLVWIFDEKEAGRLVDPSEGADIPGRRRSFMGLDKEVCRARDPKSAWRFRWAWPRSTRGPTRRPTIASRHG